MRLFQSRIQLIVIQHDCFRKDDPVSRLQSDGSHTVILSNAFLTPRSELYSSQTAFALPSYIQYRRSKRGATAVPHSCIGRLRSLVPVIKKWSNDPNPPGSNERLGCRAQPLSTCDTNFSWLREDARNTPTSESDKNPAPSLTPLYSQIGIIRAQKFLTYVVNINDQETSFCTWYPSRSGFLAT